MRKLNKIGMLTMIMPMLMIIFSLSAGVMAAQAPVNLGTTVGFAVLAGTTITNTGTTVINGDAGGDVGIYPGSAFTGQSSLTMSGTLHINDTAAIQAKTDLVAAFDDAAGRTPITLIPSELGGTTLIPGVYYSTDGTFKITGTLTLDAQNNPDGVFVFLMTKTLITADDSNVSLTNQARYCRIFWKVGSSATLGVNSNFVGHIFALTSISANTGASIQGQLLARNGAVTLQANIITNGICAVAQVTPTIAITAQASPTTTEMTSQAGPITGDSGTGLFFGLIMLLCIPAIVGFALRHKKKV